MTLSTRTDTSVTPDTPTPAQRVMDGCLLLAPIVYLALDCSYAVRG